MSTAEPPEVWSPAESSFSQPQAPLPSALPPLMVMLGVVHAARATPGAPHATTAAANAASFALTEPLTRQGGPTAGPGPSLSPAAETVRAPRAPPGPPARRAPP